MCPQKHAIGGCWCPAIEHVGPKITTKIFGLAKGRLLFCSHEEGLFGGTRTNKHAAMLQLGQQLKSVQWTSILLHFGQRSSKCYFAVMIGRPKSKAQGTKTSGVHAPTQMEESRGVCWQGLADLKGCEKTNYEQQRIGSRHPSRTYSVQKNTGTKNNRNSN